MIGLAGLKILMGLALAGGSGSYVDIVSLTHVGRASWEDALVTLPLYDLAKVVKSGRNIQLVLTERGAKVASLLLEIDGLLPAGETSSKTTTSPG